MVGPVVLGHGTPAFANVNGSTLSLRLLETKRWDDSDNAVCGSPRTHRSLRASDRRKRARHERDGGGVPRPPPPRIPLR
jgi:hypothetical protein